MKTRALLVAIGAITAAAGLVGLAVADDLPAAATPAPATPPVATAPLPSTPPPPPATPVTGAKAADGARPAAAANAETAEAPPAAPALPQAQLDQLLAPVALYPDQLLDQLLMASTYPLEVVEAARWVNVPAHSRLRGQPLMAALAAQHWDPSVMALVPFPQLLDAMSGKLDWTSRLGRAFLAQQTDVMAAVQRLRRGAMAAGTLNTAACRCITETTQNIITIRPANPAVVYLPNCNPELAYGAWPYPLYPPVAFPMPVGFIWPPVPFVGFYPAVDVALFGPLWGWADFNWWRGDVIVNAGVYRALSFGHPAFAGTVWAHDPARRGAFFSARATTRTRFDRPDPTISAVHGRSHTRVARRPGSGFHGGGHPHAAMHARFAGSAFHGGGPHGPGPHGGGPHGPGPHGGGPHGPGPHGADHGGHHGP